MTNHASRAMVFEHDRRQQDEHKKARAHTDKKFDHIVATDLGPVTTHEPIDPNLRPNPPVPVNPQTNGHSANGWKPH